MNVKREPFLSRCSAGFTLIELLVVISIIALLIGILLPALGAARATARAAGSLSNIRQWALSATMYATESRDWLPWDGVDMAAGAGNPEGVGAQNNAQIASNFSNNGWFANVASEYIENQRYRDLMIDRVNAGNTVPKPGDPTIFVDPSATYPAAIPYRATAAINVAPAGAPAINIQAQYLFAYVWNSKLDRGFAGNHVRITSLPETAATVLIVEARTHRSELDTLDNSFPDAANLKNRSVNRTKGDWQRFAKRHGGNKGGHLAFADGHAAFYDFEYVARPDIDYISKINGGYNKSDVIWAPKGTAN